MDELTPERLTHNSYTVGWICALDVELAASVAILDYELPKLSQVQGDTNTYVLGRIDQHNIVLTCLPAGTTGTNAAANTATNMLRSFPNIHFCLMVGIGGGAPSVPSDDPREDIRLGDVVVSCPSANSGGVLQYDFGKTMSKGRFVQTGVLNKTSIVLSNSVSTLRARHQIEESRVPQYIVRMLESNRKMQTAFSHPGLKHDQLFRAEYEHSNEATTCYSCDTEALVSRKLRENTDPVVHYGLIGSANQVMKHGATRDKLREEKNIICFEMEAAGLMDVFPCLVIRGICDYADSHKNKRWQPYAAVTAAACAKEVLLATPTSELHVKPFFKGEAIYNMLQATLYEMNWDQLLNLLPVQGYTHHECFEIPKSNEDPTYHWALRNIDFKKWSLNEGPRVLYLTGHPYEDNLSQLSSFVVGREKAAGHFVLPLFCSNMGATTTVATFLYIFLLELVYCSLDAQRTPIIRGFFSKLLESPSIRNNVDIQEKKFNKKVFSKCMKTILERAATEDLLSLLKTAFDFERRRRLLIVINGPDQTKSMDELIGCILLPLIEHLQRTQNIKTLLTSSTKSKTIASFQDALCIEYDKERKECLQSLQFNNIRYDKISEEYEGSFEWIWTHNEYKSWSISDTSRLFYIQGKPGSGKSTLMKYFNRNLLLKESTAQQAIVARFFYSFRDGELQRSHYNMLSSILYDILHQDEGFFYHQCQIQYRAHQRNDLPFKWSYDALKRVLKSLQDYRTNKSYYLTIDAVDESEEKDRRDIIGLLLELCSKMRHTVVKIFMASRPVAQLEARRDHFHNFIKLDDETRSDILNYAQLRLRDIDSTDLLDQATSYILQHAQGVFLWVQLISEQLIEAHEEGCSEQEIFELLKRLPTELEDFYGLMLEKMKHNKSSLLNAAKLFRLILFAKRPLTVDEILHALGIPDNVDSDPKFVPSDASLEKRLPSSERVILSSGGNFLEIKKSNGHKIVQIMHQTVREFFLDPGGPVANSVFWVSEAHAHAYIAITCIRYLSVCAANTALEGQLPSLHCWDAEHYVEYCRYLNRRPLASYALGYVKSHIDIGQQDANIEYATSGLVEQLASGSAGASLLERWGGSGLHQDTGSRSYIQDATAMTFRCKILRYSSIYGFSIAAELVLLAETNMNNQDKNGRTPLSLAAGKGYEAIAELLLGGGASTDIKDKYGQTPLSRAAMNGHQGIVMRLSEYGALVDEVDLYGVTPLSWAAKNGHLSIVIFLVSRRAKIEYHGFRQTPLSCAVKHGHLAIVEFLVEKGAKIDSNEFEKSPLAYAAEHGHLAIVRFLVEKGAKIDIKEYQKSPLAYAAEHGHLDIVRFLVEKGAKIEFNDFRQSPLTWAVEHGHLTIVKFLVEKGAKVESNEFRKLPLASAAEHGHLAIVRFLVEKGAQIDCSSDYFEAPLFLAVDKGHLDIVRYLISKGANAEIKNGRGETLVSRAVEINRLDIVKFLIEMC